MGDNMQALQAVNKVASDNLSSYQYHFMTLETDEEIGLAGATSPLAGILLDDPDAQGKAGLLAIGGLAWLIVDGNSVNIAAGDKLAANASGHGVKTVADGDDYGAVAQQASTADGDRISVQVVPNAQRGA